jgi:hypothetical protein
MALREGWKRRVRPSNKKVKHRSLPEDSAIARIASRKPGFHSRGESSFSGSARAGITEGSPCAGIQDRLHFFPSLRYSNRFSVSFMVELNYDLIVVSWSAEYQIAQIISIQDYILIEAEVENEDWREQGSARGPPRSRIGIPVHDRCSGWQRLKIHDPV